MQSAGVSVADGFFTGAGDVDGVQWERDFDEFFWSFYGVGHLVVFRVTPLAFTFTAAVGVAEFHIARVQLVTPSALLDVITDIEAVGAEVPVSAFDDRLIAVAIAAVGGQSSLEIVFGSNDIHGQRIDQVFGFD